MRDYLQLIRATDELAERMRALTHPGWLKQVEAMNRAHGDWLERIKALSRPFIEVQAVFAQFHAHWNEAPSPLRELMGRLAVEARKCERIEAVGWLPHVNMPFDRLEDETLDEAAISQIVEEHYRANWPSIKTEFQQSIAACELDDEATATFAEALWAHEAGMYRLTSRGLFPEIERLARTEIHNGAMDRITSQQSLREAAGGLTPTEMATSGIHGMVLNRRLQDHLYANVTTEADLARILANPVPNRHATVHGYAAYPTFKASLNALIITEFIFRTISALKRQKLGRPADQAA